LAVESAICADPAAVITIHVLGSLPCSDDFAATIELPGVAFERIDINVLFDFTEAGATAYRRLLASIPARSPAAVSNLVRYAILYRFGGVYLDFDVIVLRPVSDPQVIGAFVGIEQVWRHNERRVTQGLSAATLPSSAGWGLVWAVRRADSKLTGGRLRLADRSRDLDRSWTTMKMNNAVIGAPPMSPFIGQLLDRALDVNPTTRFALGPTLVDYVARARRDVTILPRSRFYAVPPSESYRFFEDRTLRLPAESQLIHYVSSNHRALLSTITHDDTRFDHRPELFWLLGRRVRAQLVKGVADRHRGTFTDSDATESYERRFAAR
jgi:hypothetical protein